MNKRSLRRASFSRIRALSKEEKKSASLAITESLWNHADWPNVRTIFSYLALPSEPDLTTLFLGNPEKTWGFSRVSKCGERLHFHEVDSVERLREGEFGFLEPDPNQCPELDNPDWILVPGVGFSPANLARLGRGKGHYDRFLSPYHDRSPSPRMIGVCFATQLVQIEPEEHDIPMDVLLTESGWSNSSG